MLSATLNATYKAEADLSGSVTAGGGAYFEARKKIHKEKLGYIVFCIKFDK